MEKKGKEQTTVRLPVELKEALTREADKRGLSFNGIVILAIEKYLAE